MTNRRRYICCFVLLLAISLFGSFTLIAQSPDDDYYFDELTVSVSIPRVGTGEVPAAIKGEDAFISVTDLFNLLKIKVEYSSGFDTISGFIVSEDALYTIIRQEHRIEFKKKNYPFTPQDFIRTETTLYINTKLFALFGLELAFNFRSLGVVLNTQVDLPIIREIRLQEMRKNLNRIQGEVVPDTVYRQGGKFFNLGSIDWNLYSNQRVGEDSDARLNLGIGTHFLGGEANLTLNYGTNSSFNIREQNYIWKYANNQNKVVRQISAGRVGSSGKVQLSAPIVGVSLSNTPTTYRRSFGTYVLSEMTEPHWTVELYVNNVLVDYTQADASGFFSFEVPLVYGETSVKLQFYGPYGEERSLEKTLSIPFNFLPKGTLEYNMTAGVTEDSLMSRYARADVNYGFGRSFSAGGGVEYYSALPGSEFMPYAKASLKILPEMLLSAEYIHNLKLESVLSYRFAKSLNLEFNYLRYDKDQEAYPTSVLEESKVSLSFPLRAKKFSLFTRIGGAQQRMPGANVYASDLVLSAGIGPVSMNVSTQARFFKESDPFVNSQISMSLRLPRGFIISPQTQYNFATESFTSARISMDKQFSSWGAASISYDHNFSSKSSNIDFGIRFDLSFVRFSANARRTGKNYSFSQTAGGGIILDAKNKVAEFRNRGAQGRGGLIIVPFLDINCNGVMDQDEKPITGINVNINGGVTSRIDNNTTLKVLDLEAYSSYILSINALSTENISWQLPFANIEVVAEPNRLKRIEIPVFPLGEVSGMVYLKEGTQPERGLGRIIVDIFTEDGVKIKSLLSEPDGFYNYLGLKPGNYYVAFDSTQVSRLDMGALKMRVPFTVEPSYDGDYIGGIDLTLLKESHNIPQATPTTDITTTTEKTAKKETVTKHVETTRYKVQLFALKENNRAYEILLPLLAAHPSLVVQETIGEDGLYRYGAGSYNSPADAGNLLQIVRQMGWKTAFVVSYKPSEESKVTTNMLQFVPDRLKYMIQLCALEREISDPSAFDQVIMAIENTSITKSVGRDNYTRYHLCCFTTRKQALEALRKVRSLGWKDAYTVVATE